MLAASASMLQAQDPPKPREFTADLGYVNVSGNSQAETFNLGERLILRNGRWEHKQQFGSVYGQQSGNTTTNLIFTNWRSDLALNSRLALFGYVGFDRNTFAGIKRRFEEAAGIAAKLVTLESDVWTAEIGVAMNQQTNLLDVDNNFASIRSGTVWRHNFSKVSYFLQSLEFLPNLDVSEDYRMNSETAFIAPISSHVNMKVAYLVRFDNLPEAGKQSSDKIFTTGLQFAW